MRIMSEARSGSPDSGPFAARPGTLGASAVLSGVSVLLAVLVLGVATGMASAQQQDRSPVVVAPVVQQQVSVGQTFVGTVQAKRRASVGSAVDGRVLEFPVNEGDFVQKGQTLCQLRTRTLEIELAGAKAELALKRHELEELENGSRPEEIAEAEARVDAAKAVMDYAKAKLERVKMLYRRGQAVSQDELDAARSEAISAERAYDQEQASYALVQAGPREERILQARAAVAMQEQIVEGISDKIVKHTLIAPFDGFVTSEHTEQGQWLRSGEPAADVVEVGEVDVLVHLPERVVANARVGQEATVAVDALPERTFIGRIVLVVPQADVRARTFPVKIRVSNDFEGQKPVLMPGMLARASLSVGQSEQALLVPKDALVLGGKNIVVYVVDVESGKSEQQLGTVRSVPVELGAPTQGLIEVKAELSPGELVVVRGNERLRADQAVAISRVVQPQLAEASIR